MTLTGFTIALLLAAGADPAAPPPPSAGTGPAAAAAPVAVTQDPAALAIVKRMAERLQRARTFTFQVRVAMELPTDSGTFATYHTRASVAVRRPDGLAARRGGDLPAMRFAYDGKTMTTYVPGTGKWGTTAAPPTLDAMLFAAFERGGVSFPADELMVADPYAAITKGATEVALVGRSGVVGANATDHVLLASPGMRLEFWIDPATALPSRAVVIYTDEPLRPHFLLDYSDWKIDPALPASTFALPRPAAGEDVGFREACSAFR